MYIIMMIYIALLLVFLIIIFNYNYEYFTSKNSIVEEKNDIYELDCRDVCYMDNGQCMTNGFFSKLFDHSPTFKCPSFCCKNQSKVVNDYEYIYY
jgi:hypothetical protein